MSLGREWIDDHMFELTHPFGCPEHRGQDIYWITRNGIQVKISDMTTQHIVNCMNLVGEDDDWYAVFSAELNRRANKQ